MTNGGISLQDQIFILIAALAVVAGALYGLTRYFGRKRGTLARHESRQILDDRSYNQLRIGRAAADSLERSGADVRRARRLLDDSEAARGRHDFAAAIDLAKRAQDQLARAHQGLTGDGGPSSSDRVLDAPSGTSSTTPPANLPSTGDDPRQNPPPREVLIQDPVGSGEPEEGEPGRRGQQPKNKLEARFQRNLLSEELGQAGPQRTGEPNFRAADRLREEAASAFDRADFTEALRLALKGRRTLGAKVETLPKEPGTRIGVPPVPAPAGSGNPPGPGAAANVGVAARCSVCGRALGTSDRFCRGCGSPLASVSCAKCGQPIETSDRFCGSCGAPALGSSVS